MNQGTTAVTSVPPLPGTPPDFPRQILRGDVVAHTYISVSQRLREVLRPEVFSHHHLPPSPNRATWEKLSQNGPSVALGCGIWRAERDCGMTFRGTLIFPVAVLLRLPDPQRLYLGTGQLRGIGVAGIMAVFATCFHGWALDGIGTCKVTDISVLQTEDWFEDRACVVAAELTFEHVSPDLQPYAQQLDDFLRWDWDIEIEKEQPRG
ncbi:hypothetical protein E3E12_06025 [Formicincola oecophyllae]|uniref:Uncharacterized protein n=1 Tax=Formicincola oecophyllae TaxID=2558361 RepID=A0A4Y6U8N5_9PROT|nr:hypothetical protein [Formicincola oecophyllae]QDH13813.1 hypothetical protein E3E12_06025 [Formicincola oecophyllae]